MYQTMFETHLTRVKLSQENAIRCLIGVGWGWVEWGGGGLKSELNIVVKITSPI